MPAEMAFAPFSNVTKWQWSSPSS